MICAVNLERYAEHPQKAGHIQFDPVDLVSFLPVTLERSRGRDFEAGIAVFWPKKCAFGAQNRGYRQNLNLGLRGIYPVL